MSPCGPWTTRSRSPPVSDSPVGPSTRGTRRVRPSAVGGGERQRRRGPASTPSMLDRERVLRQLATPMTDGPVSKSVANPPIDSAWCVRGPEPVGNPLRNGVIEPLEAPRHRRHRLEVECAFGRAAIHDRRPEVTTTGWATPTTSPRVGSTDTMASCGVARAPCRRRAGSRPDRPARTIATRTHLPAWRIASISH